MRLKIYNCGELMMKLKISILIIACVPFCLAMTCDDGPSPSPGPADAGLYHTYSELNTELQQLQASYPRQKENLVKH